MKNTRPTQEEHKTNTRNDTIKANMNNIKNYSIPAQENIRDNTRTTSKTQDTHKKKTQEKHKNNTRKTQYTHKTSTIKSKNNTRK